jgi:hypothetical protein
MLLQFNQFRAQSCQQGFQIAETPVLASGWLFQNATQNHRLGGRTVLGLAADNERAIDHRIDFHGYSIAGERQSNAN